jgi:hypothetical protein
LLSCKLPRQCRARQAAFVSFLIFIALE